MKVAFELSDSDLKYFRRVMKEVAAKHSTVSEEVVIDSARQLLSEVDSKKVPQFVSERIAKLGTLLDMLDDADWDLTGKDRTRVLRGIAYFAEPEDMIPDRIPVLGFLDDAIMIELVVRELRHEIDAYNDFCEFRERERSRAGNGNTAKRQDKLNTRRTELQSRMRRRRQRNGDSSELRILD